MEFFLKALEKEGWKKTLLFDLSKNTMIKSGTIIIMFASQNL